MKFCEKCGMQMNDDLADCFQDIGKTRGASLYYPNSYDKWREKNSYYGRQFSVLGDSISTLEGYNPRGYKVFYESDNCQKSNVKEMSDTWWGKVIYFFGGELLVNNSWSGSRVTGFPVSEQLFPSACSDERTFGLHINSVMPDVILVYLGINDWANGVETKQYDPAAVTIREEYGTFESAYKGMLGKIKRNYPNAEIWCGTLNKTYMSSNSGFVFPCEYAGIHIREYNEIIRKSAAEYRCKLIDFDRHDLAYDSIDGTHPSYEGMDTLAKIAISEIGGSEAEHFMEYRMTKQESVLIDEEVNDTNLSKKIMNIVSGDITKINDVNAIVNAARPSLMGGGGVDGAIHKAAGVKLSLECLKLHGCKTGQAKMTHAYNLPCDYIIHTVGPVWKGGGKNEEQLLSDCYWNSLKLAAENNIHSIAFPSISTGIYHFPLERAAHIALITVKTFIDNYPKSFDKVVFVLFDDNTKDVYQNVLSKLDL
jgi:O-acetyl-ADP-ribose deacetylase (regulator of RNase III)